MKNVNLVLFLLLLFSIEYKAQNSALDFDGDDDQLVGETPITQFDDFTIEIWFKGENLNASPIINLMAWGDNTIGFPHRFHVVLINDKIAILDDAAANGLSFLFPLTSVVNNDNEWHHLAIVKKLDDMTLYLDDEVGTYKTERFHDFILDPQFIIGQRVGDRSPAWDGLVDEFRIWDRAMPEADIVASRDCELEGDEAGLVQYFKFDQVLSGGGVDLIEDQTSGNRDAVLNNFALTGNSSNVVSIMNPVDGSCSGCSASFSFIDDPCSTTHTFIAVQNPQIDSYDWQVTTEPSGNVQIFSGPSINFALDQGNILNPISNYEVCLTTVDDDGCEANRCEDFIPELFTSQFYYEVLEVPEDVLAEANPITCNLILEAQNIDLFTCSFTEVSQSHSRSDGLSMMDPYEIGITTITVEVIQNIGFPFSVESFTYDVVVEEVPECCMSVPDISMSLIPNPDFELSNCIPDDQAELNCAVSWKQATQATSDLFDLDEFPDLRDLTTDFWTHPAPPNGKRYVGVYRTTNAFAATSTTLAACLGSEQYVEYVGSELLSPILKEEEYTLNIKVGSPNNDDNFPSPRIPPSLEADFVVLGLPDNTNFPISGCDCKEDDYEVIGTTSISLDAGTWGDINVTIDADKIQDYNFIMFGLSCERPLNGFLNYLLVDDINLVPGIVEVCDPCDPNFEVDITSSLIPNADFENLIPGSSGPATFGDLEQAADWNQATGGTSDLYSQLTYPSNSTTGDVSPSPNGSNNSLGFYSWETNGTFEYVGACLIEPFLENNTYTLSAYFGAPSGGIGEQNRPHGGDFFGDVVVLGIPFCPTDPGTTNWQAGVFAGDDCKEDSFDEIGRFSLDIAAGTWLQEKRDIELTPLQDYQAIMFGVACGNTLEPFTSRRNYLLIDEILIREGEACPEPSDCFTVVNETITCVDHRTYDVTLQIRNENDQVFDRLLTFAQNNQTAVNPTISINFGDGMSTLDPGDISGDISFQVRRQNFVDEEIEICFDVIPQDPSGDDCCLDDFCLTFPVCCVPEESKSSEINLLDTESDCCYDIEVANVCATDYFKSLTAQMTNAELTLTPLDVENGWNVQALGDGALEFFYKSGVTNGTGDYVPLYDDATVVGTICLDGITTDNIDDQELILSWISCDDAGNDIVACTENYVTECTSDPCNMVTSIDVNCDNNNNYQLTFDVLFDDAETNATKVIVINPLQNTEVSNYSPQSFDNLNFAPGTTQTFTIDLHEMSAGEAFNFSVTMHDFDTPLPNGKYWCCDGEETSVTLPQCGIIGAGVSGVDYEIYPNPVEDVFTIGFKKPTETNMELELLTMQGELIKSQDIDVGTEKHSLSMRTVLPAVYFIKLTDDNGQTSYRKILKL